MWPRVLALAAHELRTTAGVIAGSARLLQRDGADDLDAARRALIEAADRSGQRLATVLAQLSELAHLEDGTTTLLRQPLALADLLHPLVSPRREASPTIVAAGPWPAASLHVDGTRLLTALRALADAHAAGGRAESRVHVAAGVRDGSVWIALGTDPGLGTRTGPASGRHRFDGLRGGHGLGLVLAWVVVALHGGDIHTEPAGTTGGAITVVRLPLAAAP